MHMSFGSEFVHQLQSPVSPASHPSLGRDLQLDGSSPKLLHSLHELDSSVLSLAANDSYIFSGSQNEHILVWDKKTFQLKTTLRGHRGSILALVYAEDKKWLFSSSGDCTVRVWCTETLRPVYIIDPFNESGAGDLFSLAWSPTLQTIYVGCQNTSLQWLDLSGLPAQSSSLHSDTSNPLPSSFSIPDSGTSTPTSAALRKAHKFFDSYPLYERRPADIFANNSLVNSLSETQDTVPRLVIPCNNVIESVHYGYIYCLSILDEGEAGVRLASGSGDETVKVWSCTKDGPTLEHNFPCSYGAVLSLIIQGDTIYGGCQDGHVKVLDLETRSLVRTIIVQEGVDILSLSLIDSDLYTCSASGQVQRYSGSFDCTACWHAHDGIVLSSIISDGTGKNPTLVTGGNDGRIKVWDIVLPPPRFRDVHRAVLPRADPALAEGSLTYALSKFVSFPSVSSGTSHREDCRQAAIWLKKCLQQLGAFSHLLPTSEGVQGKNPLVLGTFTGNQAGQAKRPRLLFYGHYDVIPAPPQGWNSDPFVLDGRNGYLYGRGVNDNKGPIISTAFAVAELLYRRALGVDVVFLIEGEEECGSTGFEEAIQKYKSQIGHIDGILVSNSTWISEDSPCITYGLRGVIHCSLEITSSFPDLHSGIDGGGVREPMLDMVTTLATLTNSQQVVQIPKFYDHVRPQTEQERELYQRLSSVTQKSASSLSSRWCQPSLTVHNVEISGPKNATVIPGTVKSQVSVRIVPDQDLNTIADSLCQFLKQSFDELQSPNKLQVQIVNTADWWLGQLDDPWFVALESAVREEWGVEPLRIREGGSIPSVPFLEKVFKCHALHLPMGQSLDRAHLPNERMSLTNLERGKKVIARFLAKVASMGTTA
ncbi:glutathione degradosome [Dendrothele bispora CBS 962.96]|uniref:Glutathione degradosome n=1 Tax=Dendrothele bispora (strain CBS 962.96) TaxID=1314807 RepID=A0A4S8LV24_DENBC|nr:glutathione degradosome [Dendrothele bispora CBS 962.96]